MTTAAVISKGEAREAFARFNPKIIMPTPRPVKSDFIFDAKALTYHDSCQSSIIISRANSQALIEQARNLRRYHFWRIWGLRAPKKRVIEAVVKVIDYCPTELLLYGYSVENYGNGTVVLMKRSENYMTTISVGSTSLSYAKLNMRNHKVVDSGTCSIEMNAVRRLFEMV